MTVISDPLVEDRFDEITNLVVTMALQEAEEHALSLLDEDEEELAVAFWEELDESGLTEDALFELIQLSPAGRKLKKKITKGIQKFAKKGIKRFQKTGIGKRITGFVHRRATSKQKAALKKAQAASAKARKFQARASKAGKLAARTAPPGARPAKAKPKKPATKKPAPAKTKVGAPEKTKVLPSPSAKTKISRKPTTKTTTKTPSYSTSGRLKALKHSASKSRNGTLHPSV
jgi:hypothetical protein